MSEFQPPRPDEVEHLLRNAELRDELEPFFDESITALDVQRIPTPVENEFLASMLAWERAPILPIAQWFEPPLCLPPPDSIDDRRVEALLWDAVQKLFEKQIVLDFTDHLSDRQLYCLIYRDILPSREKKIDNRNNYLHWDCAGVGEDAEIWLRYYASDEERSDWHEQFPDDPLPERLPLPHRRRLPRRPL
ncbi:MAG TPA: hypothetical protein VG713_16500 [Pirellulales bacterium]|nr:hypothetical protein [Pirellulales bacterium]